MSADTALARRVLDGDVAAAARAISVIEEDSPAAREIMAEIYPRSGGALAIGVTGPPGVGKSTLVSGIVRQLRRDERRVAVLAVDPSSPFSGGAVLGDRVRMMEHSGDGEVFTRSMASRGHVGGLALATPAALRILDAAGFERIIIESVGVGQNEVDVAFNTDCTVLVFAPGAGDGVQAMKAGILEIGDLIVVNKSDVAGANQTAATLRSAVRHRKTAPKILLASASTTEGVEEVAATIEEVLAADTASGRLEKRRASQLRRETLAYVVRFLERSLTDQPDALADASVLAEVVGGELDPQAAALRITESLLATDQP